MANSYRGQVDASVVGEGCVLAFTWSDIAEISKALGKGYFGEILTVCEGVSAGFAGLDEGALAVLRIGLRNAEGNKLSDEEWSRIDVPAAEIVDVLVDALCRNVHGLSKDDFFKKMDELAAKERAAAEAAEPDPTEAVNATS